MTELARTTDQKVTPLTRRLSNWPNGISFRAHQGDAPDVLPACAWARGAAGLAPSKHASGGGRSGSETEGARSASAGRMSRARCAPIPSAVTPSRTERTGWEPGWIAGVGWWVDEHCRVVSRVAVLPDRSLIPAVDRSLLRQISALVRPEQIARVRRNSSVGGAGAWNRSVRGMGTSASLPSWVIHKPKHASSWSRIKTWTLPGQGHGRDSRCPHSRPWSHPFELRGPTDAKARPRTLYRHKPASPGALLVFPSKWPTDSL